MEAQQDDFYMFLISGKTTEQNLYKIFEPLLEDYKNQDMETLKFSPGKRNSGSNLKHLVIKLDLINDNDLDLTFLDAFLFELVVLRMIRLEGYIRFLPQNMRIKFELAHSQDLQLNRRLKIFQLVSQCEMHFSIERFEFQSRIDSMLQIVGNFFDQIDRNVSIGSFSVPDIEGLNIKAFAVNSKHNIGSLTRDRVVDLLRKYFLSECRKLKFSEDLITFAHLNLFLRIVCKEFVACNYLAINKKIKAKKLRFVYLSIIKTTVQFILPFSESIKIQKMAFEIKQR